MTGMKKVGKALTMKDFVCFTQVRIVSLKKRPKVPTISTKQIMVPNCFSCQFPNLASLYLLLPLSECAPSSHSSVC